MTKHTEIPYEVYIGHDNKFIDNPYIIAKDGSATKAPTDICQVFWHGNKSGSTALANARFIVKACNNHDALMEVVENAEHWIKTMASDKAGSGVMIGMLQMQFNGGLMD